MKNKGQFGLTEKSQLDISFDFESSASNNEDTIKTPLVLAILDHITLEYNYKSDCQNYQISIVFRPLTRVAGSLNSQEFVFL